MFDRLQKANINVRLGEHFHPRVAIGLQRSAGHRPVARGAVMTRPTQFRMLSSSRLPLPGRSTLLPRVERTSSAIFAH